MKIKLFIIFTSLFILSFYSSDAEEKDDSRTSGGSMTIGIGSGSFGPTLYTNLTYIANNNLFILRYWKADEFRFNVEGHYDEPALSCNEFGILYGRRYQKEYLIMSLSAGISYINGINRGKILYGKQYERVSISTVGLPFEARFCFKLGFIGLGGTWYGNINSRRNTTGALFEISVGVF